MSITFRILSVPAPTGHELWADPDVVPDFFKRYFDGDFEGPDPQIGTLDLDMGWAAMHFLLTGQSLADVAADEDDFDEDDFDEDDFDEDEDDEDEDDEDEEAPEVVQRRVERDMISEGPLTFIFKGGQRIDFDTGYDKPRWLPPDEVKALSIALAEVTERSTRARFDEVLKEQSSMGSRTSGPTEEDFAWLSKRLDDLKTFTANAVQHGRGFVLMMI